MLDVVLPTLLLAILFVSLKNLPGLLVKQPLKRGGLSYRLAPRPPWVIQRDGITVSASTTALNPLPKRLVSKVEAFGAAARDRVKRFYDIGVAFGIFGVALGVLAAVWALVRVWMGVWHEAEAHARIQDVPSKVLKVVKRALDQPVPQVHSSSGGLQPLIPGVTAPLSHLPTLVLAFVLAQLLHELGHAIAGALEDITPSKFAFSLHLFLPSASVVFPSSVDFLPMRARARLATSGPWHNLLLWFALYAASGLGDTVFWTDRAAEGRIVSEVASGTPLADHLRLGDLITHINDVFVGGHEDLWTLFLSGTVEADTRGWCINKWEFGDAAKSPCEGEGLIAFQQIGEAEDSTLRCLEPHSIVSSPPSSCHCAGSQVCIAPAASEHILRIRYKSGRKRDLLLWSGDRSVVLETVKVSTRSPRLWGSGTRWVALFFAYLKMVTISLYLVNLLPLPHTDGIQLLSAIMSSKRTRHARQLSSQASSRHPTINPYRYDADRDSDSDSDGPEPSWATGHGRREEIWQRRLRRVVEGTTAAVVVAWILGWFMLALLRSS